MEYTNEAANPIAMALHVWSASDRGSFATPRARAQLQPISPRLLKMMGHNRTVASSPRAEGPRMRAVKIPVITPQAWIARLVKNVPILALEKIIRKIAMHVWSSAILERRPLPRDEKPD